MELPVINRHEDHEATCLCCDQLDAGYDGGYADTPGEGPYLNCLKGVFESPKDHWDHNTLLTGRTCEQFVPKQ